MQINTWVITSRGPDGAQIPKYPSEAEGGSKSFLEPLPAAPQGQSAEQAKGRQPGRAASAAAKGKEPPKKAGATKSMMVQLHLTVLPDKPQGVRQW